MVSTRSRRRSKLQLAAVPGTDVAYGDEGVVPEPFVIYVSPSAAKTGRRLARAAKISALVT